MTNAFGILSKWTLPSAVFQRKRISGIGGIALNLKLGSLPSCSLFDPKLQTSPPSNRGIKSGFVFEYGTKIDEWDPKKFALDAVSPSAD